MRALGRLVARTGPTPCWPLGRAAALPGLRVRAAAQGHGLAGWRVSGAVAVRRALAAARVEAQHQAAPPTAMGGTSGGASGGARAQAAAQSGGPREARVDELAMTHECSQRINELACGDDANHVLRLSVKSGGCSGFQYEFDLVHRDTMDENDIYVEREGATLVVDNVSLDMLSGSVVHYEAALIRASFKVSKNPHAEAGCGCGVSFQAKGVEF